MLLVVVYRRAAVRAVVAALSALLLACGLLLVAVRWWPVSWRCCWPAAGLLLVRAVRVVAGGLAGGRMRPE